jgi:hypothetical protein
MYLNVYMEQIHLQKPILYTDESRANNQQYQTMHNNVTVIQYQESR